MADGYTVDDRRGTNRRTGRAVPNVKVSAAALRARGYGLPKSKLAAEMEAANVNSSLENRELVSSMRNTGSTRTASTQMALPKVREPMSSLKDKNIPYDTTDAKELIEIRRWARLFYTTHDLIPLLIDIYSKFPLVGMEFTSKDSEIKRFYDDMFMDQLDYESFLQDLGREFFISGEVNSLAHFDETLGIFSSEEILNPDALSVSKSMFVKGERVQLLVKDLVENLRKGTSAEEGGTRSEELEKNFEYQQLVKYYPEIIQAAQSDDGLDISDALISRIVNKVQPWDVRGTPHLLRSFRTLLMEESLNAAQDAVADRLYSPFILATLGIPNLGDGEPWIPDQADLDDARDTMQDALAADFRLMVHNFGLQVTSVFGRESVPRFDTDYARVDKKLMQAWGIGEALISGGAGQASYASSALNREFVTQMMSSFQKQVKRHIRKRCEVIAEAQGHFDYEVTGSTREPIMREIVEVDEEGYEYTRKVPKLLIPEVKMSTLNLRDETQERAFLQQLRNVGVPISDTSLAVNIPIEFTEELEKQSDEKVAKLLAESQAMQKAYTLIKAQNLPMPPDLAKYMAAQIQLEQAQAEADKAQAEADNPTPPGGEAGGGAPFGGGGDGEDGSSTAPEFGSDQAKSAPMKAPGSAGGGGKIPVPGKAVPEDASAGAGRGTPQDSASGSSDGALGDMVGNDLDNSLDNSEFSPGFERPDINQPIVPDTSAPKPNNVVKLNPRNRQRPEESDEQRKNAPKTGGLVEGPSSYGSSRRLSMAEVQAATDRLAAPNQTLEGLVGDDEFFTSLNREGYMAQIRNDMPELREAVRVDRFGDAHLVKSRMASNGEPEADPHLRESFAVLCEMVDQYEETFGWRPEW